MLKNSFFSQTATTVVFIDSSVSDYQTLQTGIVGRVETVILSQNRDGIEEITDFLQQNPQIATVYIVAHGSSGCLYLGNSQLNLDNLQNYQSLITTGKVKQILLDNSNGSFDTILDRGNGIAFADLISNAIRNNKIDQSNTSGMISDEFPLLNGLTQLELQSVQPTISQAADSVIPSTNLHIVGCTCSSCALPPVDPNFIKNQTQQLIAAASTALDLSQTFSLNSLAGANQTIYLDFNGHTTSGTAWNTTFTGGSNIVTSAFDFDGNTASFSTAELERIQYIWQRVAEDFRPFNVNITTQAPTDINDLIKSSNSDTRWGVRVAIGGSSYDWFGAGAGGVASLGSFSVNWNTDTPAFVFDEQLGNGEEKATAEAITHEVGHTLGLKHDGRISPAEEYYLGHSSGETGWASIMGAGYYQNLTQWSSGQYASANNTEDDLQIITTQNGFSYRADDTGNTTVSAKALNISGTSVSGSGIIERNTDVDYYSFSTAAGAISLTVNPFNRGPNLDILAELYNSAGTLIASSNPTELLSASIATSVAAGTYYLKIDGVGKGDPLTTGYTDYGSLGQYSISGNTAVNNAPVITTTSTALSYIENATTVIDSAILVSDVDSVNLASATVSITSGFTSGQDFLNFTNQNGITGIYNNATGVLTLTGAATVAFYQIALRSITYTNNSDNPNTTARTIQFSVNDGGVISNLANRNVTITAVNDAPTNLNLSNTNIAENQAVGTVIGNFSTTDPDTGNTFSYSLVTGIGATDNALFTITNNQLTTNAVFDYETKNSYSIRVKTTDQGGLSSEKQLIIGVSNINETPTNLTLSNSTVAENQPINTVIGNLSTTDPDTGNTFTYSLVTGTGATDNALFSITNNQLITNTVFDYETKNSYSIRVKTTDQGGLSSEKQLTIGVSNVNETPTNLTLSNSTVAENQAINTVIGNLSTTDPDTANTFTYNLVTGIGATDNSLFSITNNQLTTNAVFDYETKNSYSIRVKTTDQGGLFAEKQLTIGVSNVNETPTNLTLSNSNIAENQAINTVIGNLSTTDPDTANTFTYNLVTGIGATDNSLFSITNNQLTTNAVFDYETKNSYSIRVKTTDQGGLSSEKQLTIGVSNVNEVFGDWIVSTNITDGDSKAFAVQILADGKILVAGYTWNGKTGHDIVLLRYNSNGTLDTTFNGSGIVVTDSGFTFPGKAYSLKVQADGKILLAGSSTLLIRYNSDGSIDNTFGGGDGTVWENAGGVFSDLAVQNDGKIIAVGSGFGTVGFGDFGLVRYNNNGTLDTSFGVNGIVSTNLGGTEYVRSIKILSDGKILVTGYTFSQDIHTVRYNSNGSIDTTFGGGDGIVTTNLGGSDQAHSLTLQSDGRFIVAGSNGIDFALARYNTDGSLDTTFGGGDGIVTTNLGTSSETAYSVTVLSDGKILVTGNNGDIALVRYNSDGSLDPTFDTDGIVTTNLGSSLDYGRALAVQSDGKIVVVGDTDTGDISKNSDIAVVRYNINGSLDSGFGTNGIVTTKTGSTFDIPSSLTIQSDGKIVVVGYSETGGYDNGDRSWDEDQYDWKNLILTRYNSDGTLDNTFGGGDGIVTTSLGKDDFGGDVLVQPDGKIVIASYTQVGNYYDFAIVRYNTDGSFDTSFGGGDGIVTTSISSSYDYGRSLAIQVDGKLVVAGYSNVTGVNRYGFSLVRYNINGTLDTRFGGGDGIVSTDIGSVGDYGQDVVIQADGKIVVAGYTTIDNSNSDFTVMRYNIDGSLDTSFGGGDGIVTTSLAARDEAYSLVLQADGKLLVAGQTYNGNSWDWGLVRYNSDGSLDTSFGGGDGIVITNIGSAFDLGGYDIAVQPNGKILVTGRTYGTQGYNIALARYNIDGTLDTSFGGGDGIFVQSGYAESGYLPVSLAIQGNDKIFLAASANGDLTLFSLSGDVANQAPTNLTLSNSTVAENQSVNTVIGNLSSTDPDTGNTFTYSLVTGIGATDNALFTITNNQLITNAVFDYETKNSYSIRVKTTDQGGLSFEKQLTINISDLPEYSAIESAGNTKLVKDYTNKYFTQIGTNTPIAIKNGGQQISQDIYGSGWQTIAAETVNGVNQVLWKNVSGNYLHIWRLDNNWNWVSSEGQWALNSAEVLTQETNFGIDVNGDGVIGNPYTPIESAGNTKFIKDTTNKYFTQIGTNTPTAIKNGGQQIYQDIYAGWQTLAAETVNGVNQLLWKNVSGNYLHIWRLDNNWNWVSSEGQWALNSAEVLTQETNFGIDVNGDGVIGNPYTPIESAGNTKFIKDTTNKYFTQIGTNTPTAIKNGGQQIYQDIYAGWQTLAAETVNGVNQLLWKNVSGNYLHIWRLDNNWNWVSSEGQWALNSAEVLTQETNFGIDVNGDGVIGNPYTPIESAGNTKFIKDTTNKYFTQIGTNTPTAIKNGGQQIYQDIYAGWQTLAAETVNGVNQLLWKNVSGNYLHIWRLDNNWNWVSSEGQWALNSAEVLTQETNFGIDVNGDGVIGNPYTPIESAGNTKFIKDTTNKYFTQIGTNTPTAIKNGGQQIYQDIYAGWQTLAAETVNGDNQVLWKNTTGNFLLIWHLDSNWNLVSGEGNWGLNSAEAFTQETVFGTDANGDGKIGNPSSLTLTGTSGNDILIGGANNDLLTGAGGKDTLTGGLSADKFVYQNLSDSLLANFDVITDFNATTGNDLFRVSTVRAGFVDVGAVNTLDTAGIGAKLTAAAFGSNFAAQFSFGQKTFVAINDATAGFNAANDAIIEVTGLTGTLNVNHFVII